MRALYVLYDAQCALCRRCARFLMEEQQIVPVHPLRRDGERAARLFPSLDLAGEDLGKDDLVVVSSEGGVYRGPDAFIVCLWALQRYRGWAMRLARPALRPLARVAFEGISENRARLSRLWRGRDEQLVEGLRALPAKCNDGSCTSPVAGTGRASGPGAGRTRVRSGALGGWRPMSDGR